MKMNQMIGMCVALGLMGTASLQANIFAYDGFATGGLPDYVGGNELLGTQNPTVSGFSGGWTTPSAGIRVADTGLSYGSLEVSGGSVFRDGSTKEGTRALSSQLNSGVVYASFLLQSTIVSNRSQVYFDSVFRVGINGGNFSYRIGGDTVISPATADETNLLVVKFDFTTPTAVLADIYVNPAIGGVEPSATVTAIELGSFNIDNIKLYHGSGGSGITTFDEIRFGDSFAAVTPVPEPSTYALLGGILALGLVVLQRRRQGS
jgi:hypothetical protein